MAIDKSRRLMELAGVGTGSGQLAKLRIMYESPPAGWLQIDALFNPTELSYSQSFDWQERKTAAANPAVSGRSHDFRGSGPQTFNLKLFFDTYERHDDQLTRQNLSTLLPTLPFAASEAADVRLKHTNEIVALGRANSELHRPPICKLYWGRTQLFVGVLTSVEETLTMFLPDGTAVRATLACTFTAYKPETLARNRELHSADVAKSRVVKRGESLQSIAAEEYNDPGLWRHIARANHIVNPRRLAPGTELFIPSLPIS
ncbi:MAG: LysM peptidoglycan-binding domain-containing protein [Anaerolineaceae bacterium]|nr:LysM peptidoglycan-binding domain-containing protein [Anaerolineaceae bacterium]